MSPAMKSSPDSVKAFTEVGINNPAATVTVVATAANTRFQKLDTTQTPLHTCNWSVRDVIGKSAEAVEATSHRAGWLAWGA